VTKIAATEEQVFQIPASPQEVYAFFTDLEALCETLTGVKRYELLPGSKVHWVLEEKAVQGIRFQPDYIVVFDGNGIDYVRCRSVEGNMRNDWDAWIEPTEGGSKIHYREMVEVDLPITTLLAMLIRPLVVRELRGEVSLFLDRIWERLASRTAAN